MAPSTTKRPRPGPALVVFIALIAVIFGGIVANAQFGKGKYYPQLGLDLAGGTTVTLTAVTESGKKPPKDQIDKAVDIIRQRVNGLGIAESQVTAQDDSIIVQVPGQGQRKVVEQVGQTAKLYFRQVMVTAPGAAVPKPTPTGKSGKPSQRPKQSLKPTDKPSGRAISKALESQHPQAQAQGSGRPAAAPSTMPTNLPTNLPTQQPPQQQQNQPDLSGIKQSTLKEFEALDCSQKKNRAGGGVKVEKAKEQVVACDRTGSEKYILGPSEVLGTAVTKAQAVSDTQKFGQWTVTLDFNGKGSKQFGALTTKASQAQSQDRKRIAIELDHVVQSAPSIDQGPITGGTAEITGDFKQTEAQDLSNVLKYGALPLQFRQSSIQSVSPTLGRELLNGGLIAGAIGLGIVVVYVFLYYRGLGMVSILSLAGSALLTFGSVTLMSEFIGYRLSLAGIGGLIVAIGITADSFIVFFERLRDEVREGKTLRQATERSWVRARRTILTADTITFMAALILYAVSVDQVKGFAFTLGLTTLIDVLVVFLFTKPLMTLLVRTRFFGSGHRMSGLNPSSLGVREIAQAKRRQAKVREA